MPIQQDQLNPTTTSITFEDFHNTITGSRILHNGSDFIKCEFEDEANPIIRYYRTNGDKAVAYAMEKDNIVDLAYDSFNDKYYTVRHYVDNQESFTSSGINYLTTTGANYSYDHFDNTNIVFPVPDGEEDLLTRFGGKMEMKRDLGDPNNSARLVYGDPDSVSPTPPIGDLDLLPYGFPLIENSFTTSLEYNMPLSSIAGTEYARLSMTVFDQFNGNMRYSVGVATSGTGSSDSTQVRIAISGSEDVSSPSLVRFREIYIDEDQSLLLSTSGTDSFTVTVKNSTASGSLDTAWEVITPMTGVSGTVVAWDDINQYYDDGLVQFRLAKTGQLSGPLEGVGSDIISFNVDLAHKYLVTNTGTLDISRTSGTSPLYSSSIDSSFNYGYGIFDFLANEGLFLSIELYTEQFDFTSIELYEFFMTSGSIPEQVVNADTLVTVTTDTFTYKMLDIDRVNSQGDVSANLINRFNILNPLVERRILEYIVLSGTVSDTTTVISGSSELPDLAMTVDYSSNAYLMADSSVYTIDLAETYTTTGIVDPSTSGITTSSGLAVSSLDFTYNPNAGGFLQYQTEEAGENLLRTLNITSSGTITNSDREVFLKVPDSFIEGDHFFLHGTDPNTLFHFRRNGPNINYKKVDSNGTFTGGILNDTTADFVISNVQTGDKVYIASLDETYTVGAVLDSNNLTLPDTYPSDGSYAYKLYAGTEQVQYNVDTSLSAFASVNVDNFSLKAGTGETADVTAEVINAWGDPLGGKQVSFIVSTGDGAVAPATDTTTTGTGAAETVYTVGVTPGPVIVTATVSD